MTRCAKIAGRIAAIAAQASLGRDPERCVRV